MSKVIYKVMDARGRITIPWEFRKMLGLKNGAIVRLEKDGEKVQVNLSRMNIVDLADQSPEAVEAYVNAAVSVMSKDKKIALAAQLLGQFKGEEPDDDAF